jgi:hypothetical protein
MARYVRKPRLSERYRKNYSQSAGYPGSIDFDSAVGLVHRNFFCVSVLHIPEEHLA